MSALKSRPTVRVLSLANHYGSLEERELLRLRTSFRKIAERLDAPVLVLDLRFVEYAGAGFLRALFDLGRRLARKEKRLLLAGPNESIRELLLIAGFPAERVHADRDSALSAAWRYGRLKREALVA